MESAAFVKLGDAVAFTLNQRLTLLRSHLFNSVEPRRFFSESPVFDEMDTYDAVHRRWLSWYLAPEPASRLDRNKADLEKKWDEILTVCGRSTVRPVVPS